MDFKYFDQNLSRRRFLKSSAVIAAAYSIKANGAEEMIQPPKKIPVGVQLWCVRKLAEKDFAGTVAAIAKMGYQGVEFAGFYNLKAADIRKILDDNGLKCCGSHTQYPTVQPDKLQETIDFNRTIGNKYLIIPYLDPRTHATKQAWIDEAKFFNDLAEKVKSQGMLVGYHNHTHEFKPVEGELPWDTFAQNTNKNVILQLDTGNCGVDPIPFLEKYPGRAVTVHLKEHSTTNPAALIGEGDINWERLLEICETRAGTEWYIIEEEKDVYPPLVAIEKSLKNFHKLRP